MKATQSNDRTLRFNVAILHRAGIEEIVNSIGWALVHLEDVYGDDFQELEPRIKHALLANYWTRRNIMRAVKSALLHDGIGIWTWSDNFRGEACEKVRQMITQFVYSKFPEFQK